MLDCFLRFVALSGKQAFQACVSGACAASRVQDHQPKENTPARNEQKNAQHCVPKQQVRPFLLW
jgi:hypothetical protein